MTDHTLRLSGLEPFNVLVFLSTSEDILTDEQKAAFERPDGRFAALIAWARERLHESLSVERLAAEAAMSARNFSRRFLEETGLTPARAIERLRVECAREKVEGSAEPIEGIAEAAGFGDAERMRRFQYLHTLFAQAFKCSRQIRDFKGEMIDNAAARADEFSRSLTWIDN